MATSGWSSPKNGGGGGNADNYAGTMVIGSAQFQHAVDQLTQAAKDLADSTKKQAEERKHPHGTGFFGAFKAAQAGDYDRVGATIGSQWGINGGGAKISNPATATSPSSAAPAPTVAATAKGNGGGIPNGGAPNGGAPPATPPAGGAPAQSGGGFGATLSSIFGGGVAGALAGSAWDLAKWSAYGGASEQDHMKHLLSLGTATRMYNWDQKSNVGNITGFRGSQNAEDWSAGYIQLLRNSPYAPGSQEFYNLQAQVGGYGVLNPLSTTTGNTNTQVSFMTASTTNALRAYGIHTYDAGTPQGAEKIARQLLTRLGIGLNGKKYTEAQIYALMGPASGFTATLNSMVREGTLTQDQRDLIAESARGLLSAQARGWTDDEFTSALSDAGSNNPILARSAQHKLQSIGYSNTTEQILKNKEADASNAALDQVDEFTDKLGDTVDALEDFRKAIRSIPGVNAVASVASALSGGGVNIGKVVGFAKGFLFPGAGGADAAQNGIAGTVETTGMAGTAVLLGNGSGGGWGAYSEQAALQSTWAGSASAGPGSSSSGNGSSSGGTGGSGATGSATSSGAPTIAPSGFAASLGGVKPWVADAAYEIKKKFPGITGMGGVSHSRGYKSDHATGLAVDFMVPYDDNHLATPAGKALGDRIAAYAVANGKRLGVTYVIWYGRIHHTPEAGGQWGPYSGTPDGNTSNTARHMDHVHVSFTETDPRMGRANQQSGNSGSGSGSGGASGGRGLAKYSASAGVGQWRGTVVSAMGQLGLPTDNSHVAVIMSQMNTESGGNPRAINKWDSNWQAGHPSVGLMQVIEGTFNAYAGPYKNRGPKAYGVSMDPMANIYAGLNYALHRYHRDGMFNYLGHGHGYAKGAWQIPFDQDAVVHKDEMIIPANDARQIREVLMQGNSYGAKKSGGGEVQIVFHSGAIALSVGAGATEADGRAVAAGFTKALAEDARIKALMEGKR